MIDISKSYEFFKPELVDDRIHIIGCGAVGSTVAEMLVRFGLKKISLYDFDVVEAHNVANQLFTESDIGKLKVDALLEHLEDISHGVSRSVRVFNRGYNEQPLNGYVLLCVDNIDLRREIATKCKTNKMIKAMFDWRIRLEDSQHYAAAWDNTRQVESLIDSMAFSHGEAAANTPRSACNLELSVCPNIRIICAVGTQNIIDFMKDGRLKTLMLWDARRHEMQAFPKK